MVASVLLYFKDITTVSQANEMPSSLLVGVSFLLWETGTREQ